MPIREGLARLEGVESVSQRPDLKADTCELRWRGGRLLDPHTLSNHVYEIRVGARVRGVEATVVGGMEKQGSDLVLRVSGTNAVLQLAPLATKVQKDKKRKRPEALTRAETKAYQTLLGKWKDVMKTVQVTGPLVRNGAGALTLQVRKFDLNPAASK